MDTTSDGNIHATDLLLDAQEAELVIQHSDSLYEYPPSDQVISREVIDEDGDVLIQTSAKEFLVSSKILALASPIFKIMFNSKDFREGSTDRSVRNPLKISLPYDGPDALSVLFHTLHFSSKWKSLKLGADLQLELARISDKYDCTTSIYGESERWLRSMNEDDHESSVLWKLSNVAFLMDHIGEFSNLTAKLALKLSVAELEHTTLHPTLPETMKSMSSFISTRKLPCRNRTNAGIRCTALLKDSGFM